MAVGVIVKKLGKGGKQAGNGGCDHGMVMVRIIICLIIICFMFSRIVISRSCLFCFFPAVLFLHYPIRQVGKGKIFGFLQNHIFHRPELRIVCQRNTFRHLVLIKADAGFFLFVPKVIQFRNARVFGKFLDDCVHKAFEFRFQIAVLLLACCRRKLPHQLQQQVFDSLIFVSAGIDCPDDLPHPLATFLPQGVSCICIVVINVAPILREDAFGKRRPQFLDAFLGKVSFLFVLTPDHQMHMGMVLLVMECRIPPEVSLRNVELLRNLRAFRTKGISPTGGGVKAKAASSRDNDMMTVQRFP